MPMIPEDVKGTPEQQAHGREVNARQARQDARFRQRQKDWYDKAWKAGQFDPKSPNFMQTQRDFNAGLARSYAIDPSQYLTGDPNQSFTAAAYNSGMVPGYTPTGVTGIATGVATGSGGGGARSSAAGTGTDGGAGAGGYTNTAEYQPDIKYAIDALKARSEGDLGAGRAIDVAVGRVRDLGVGEDAATRGRLASAGALGSTGYDTALGETGAEGLALGRNADLRQRRAAGIATDIALGREAQRDDILRSIGGMGGEQGRLGVASQGLALQQQAAQDADALAQRQAAQAQMNALLSLIGGFSSSGDLYGGGLFG
jgi:hypothetical protein